MAMNKSFSQINRFDNFTAETQQIEEPKKESKAEPKIEPKKEERPEKTPVKATVDVKKNSALSKMRVNNERKSVRKSFMLSETAVANLKRCAESVNRTENDFLNELLRNIDSYLA